MRNAFFFPHDYNSRNDEKILRMRAAHGWAGYGIYWAIIESIAESSDGTMGADSVDALAIGLGIDKAMMRAFVDDCIAIGLITLSDGKLYTNRTVEHKKFRNSMSAAGKKGARVRWNKANRVAISPPNREADAKNIKGHKEHKGHTEQNPLGFVVASDDAPTPSQKARTFFTEESTREPFVVKFVGAGVEENFVRQEIKKFCRYWTELSKNGKRQRWEREATFEVHLRLTTWLDRASTPFPRRT